ncbi:MAG TPA: ribosome biogenesis GTP-binding protein YihA/YsxC [Povalibacter sp.]|jgi:GTP-binding protein|nr:ribosome biogenesis GTP-binding protein YihA/YsxC [Povalibacter sp.]
MPQFPEAQFLTSSWQPHQFPPDEGREVAFVGRSNAGKSSALNAITGRRDLARTSKTPGRTQLINFFDLKSGQRLVDLPGYGYAKVPAEMQRHWQHLMTSYMEKRAALAALVIVMDARRGLTEFDEQMLAWVGGRSLDARVLLTKSDKLNRSESTRALREVQAAAGEAASVQLFSAVSKTGVEEARGWILAALAG